MLDLTTSSSAAYRACPRLYQLRYAKGIRPVGSDSHALRFGTAWHRLQEAWWGADSDRHGDCVTVLDAMGELDPFDRVKLRELIRGYDARWGEEPIAAVTIEQEFRVPLRNPDTGSTSRTFELAGKKDLVASIHGERWLVEHKTSSEDISPGSAYWQKLRMNAQVSNYYVGARASGHDIVGCVYDVVGKPTIKPHKATPADKRKYKKDGSLYANQRDTDETPEEYGERLREHIATCPDRYYQRAEVYRLEREELEAARDLWHTARTIRDSYRLDSWPRNDAACFRWGRPCGYWEACTGQTSIDDVERFERVRPHEELSKKDGDTDEHGREKGATYGARVDF